MSDIEREKFEQAVTDRWSDSYSFTRFGDEDYYDEVLEGMWRGWQASRQALEGEPVNGSRIEEVCVQALIDIGGCAWGIEGYPTTKEAADWMWNAANTALAEMWDSDMSVLNSEKSQSPIGYTNWAQLSYVKSDGQGSFYPDTADDCFIPLYTHPASRQAVSVPEWTDINLRQPEEYQDVLWFCQGGNIRTGMYYGKTHCDRVPETHPISRRGRSHYGKFGRYADPAESGHVVTHWMPLPCPPK